MTGDRTRPSAAAGPARFGQVLLETGVYAITDDDLDAEKLLEVVRALVDAGIRLFQYRDKRSPDQHRVEVAGRLVELVRPAGGLVLVNDRVDVAIAAGADGAHLGQDDLPFDVGRRLLGPERLLGASASYLNELDPIRSAGADYLGFGAVFPTDTKPDAEYAGLDLLEQACRLSSIPTVGIGGINLERAAAVIGRGAAGVAVVSALFRAAEPREAARGLLRAVREARVSRVEGAGGLS